MSEFNGKRLDQLLRQNARFLAEVRNLKPEASNTINGQLNIMALVEDLRLHIAELEVALNDTNTEIAAVNLRLDAGLAYLKMIALGKTGALPPNKEAAK